MDENQEIDAAAEDAITVTANDMQPGAFILRDGETVRVQVVDGGRLVADLPPPPELEPGDGPGPIYRVKCCGSVIQSRYRHDFVWCECGKNAIDGGNAYTKVVGDFSDFEAFDPMLDIP